MSKYRFGGVFLPPFDTIAEKLAEWVAKTLKARRERRRSP